MRSTTSRLVPPPGATIDTSPRIARSSHGSARQRRGSGHSVTGRSGEPSGSEAPFASPGTFRSR